MGGTYSYPDGPDDCEGVTGQCPKISSPTDTGLIVLYSFWGLSALAFLLFHLYRDFKSKAHARDSEVVRTTRMSNALEISKASFSHNPEDEVISSLHTGTSAKKSLLSEEDPEAKYDSTSPSSILQIPYKVDTFGTICYSLVNLISVSWLVIFLVIIVDVYLDCQFRGIDCLCNYGSWPIFGNYDTSANYFFTTWCLSTVWYLGIVIYRDQLRGWFMLPSSVSDATHMYIWSRDAVSTDGEIISEDVPVIVTWLRKLRKDLTPKHLQDGHETIVKVLIGNDKSRFFIHETTRYTYDEISQTFHIPNTNVYGNTYSDFHSHRKGLTSLDAQLYLAKFGPNKIPFERNSILGLLSLEMISYFYFYQFVSYIVWFWFSYVFVASIEASVVLLGGFVSVYIQWNNEKTISSLTEYETTVKVKRDGQWTLMSSNLIVPGDILTITQTHWIIPCDMVLLSGQCIMNESGLTGESMPVQKITCPNEPKDYDHSGSKYTLYAGTTILQVTGTVECLVTKTGTGTSKGQLISTILYPEKFIFKYEEELEVTICFLLLFGLVALPLSFYLQEHNGSSSSWITKWAYGMFTVSQIFSPLLPVALKVGQIRSSKRLSEQKIFCVNPRRIAISGKVNIFCFDKTGTLTKEGMEFSGVSVCTPVVGQTRPILSKLQRDISNTAMLPTHIVECMACCHSLVKFGENEYVGNEVEINMFRASKWLLIQEEQSELTSVVSPTKNQRLVILKKYDFDHARQTMSVVVEDQSGRKHVFCKGSFEKIEGLCDQESVPPNYKHIAREFAMDGGYVLGFGYRSLPELSSNQSCATLPRDEIEVPGSFHLLGLMIFRNEPKDDSRDAIIHIREGVVRPVMITGDNAQCGQYIARSCCLVNEGSKILLGEFDPTVGDVTWTFMVDNEDETKKVKLHTSSVLEMITAQNNVEYEGEAIELALTGNHSIGHLEYTTKQLDLLLIHIRIFARTSPDSKSMIVRKFRQHGFIVGMCGDGGNDCGALRAAHAGIALSEAEASVVSPFTAHSKSPQAVVELLKEGRASLATSFANYKFLIIYGLLFSIVKLASFYYGVIMSSMSYYSIDGVAITTLTYTMTLSRPVPRLSKKRPTASLLGPIAVASTLGIFMCAFVCLVSALFLMSTHEDYVKWPAEYANTADWWTLSDNWEGTVLYAVMFIFLLSSAGIFSFGYLFREPLYSNWILLINLSILFIITAIILLDDTSYLSDLWHVASRQFNKYDSVSPVWNEYLANGGSPSPAMSFDFRLKLFILIMSFVTLAIFWQSLVMEGFIGDYIRAKYYVKKRVPPRY